MRIGIEAQAANEAVRTGVGEYAFRLLSAMMSQASSSEEVFLYTSTPLRDVWPELPVSWKSRVLPWSLPGWSSLRLNPELLRGKPDRVFFPSSALPRFAPSRRLVTTIHDIGFERFPGLYRAGDRRRQKGALRRAIKKCDHLLAVSEFTKQELIEHKGVDPSRIVVTPLGVDRHVYQPASREEIQRVRAQHHLSQHYFLFVSRVDVKKNVERLVRAFTMFKEVRGFGDPHELVIAGPPGFGFEKIKAVIDGSSAKGAIHLVGPVSEKDKVALYSGALGYVNLSWYEGFGLTPLEAAACGTPSLLSDISAHREVMGDAALFVSPKAPEVIARVWKRFAEEGATRERLLERACERVARFTWEQTAKATWNVLV